MSIFFNYNNKIYKQGEAVIKQDNRSLRYGDGLFETMKMIDGKIILEEYHFERLFAGMEDLQFKKPTYFTAAFLKDEIENLCKKNKHNKYARIRLMVFRGSGGLYDAENNLPNYIIESSVLESSTELNSNGLIIDVYKDAKKSCDKFSNIKTNNFLPYAMAAFYAKENKLNDCILLNTYERICDTTIANIFIIKNKIIYTPPLSEGCIAGVTRRWMLENLSTSFKIFEKPLTQNDLLTADEVFLTNSISDLRWVKGFGDKNYDCNLVKKIRIYFNKAIY